MPRPVAVAAITLLLLTGCAEQQPAAPPATAAVSPSPVATPTPTAASTPVPAPTVSPAPKAARVSLTVHRGPLPTGVHPGPAWLAVSAGPASASVTITWTDAVSPGCGVVKDAWLEETSTAVILDLVRSPRRAGIACPLLLAPRLATVTLATPLGDRTLEEHAGLSTAG